MEQYLKTNLGIQALKQRSFQLNARQRQLLLLIGTEDFKILNSEHKQRLATPDMLDQLEVLGLITQQSAQKTSKSHQQKMMQENLGLETILPQKQDHHFQSQNQTAITQIEPIFSSNPECVAEHMSIVDTHTNQELCKAIDESEIENSQHVIVESTIHCPNESISKKQMFFSLDEIKQNMVHLLQMYCGLMAKQLITKIQTATTVRELKLCQMQWITALQESKISPILLNQTMQQINFSLNQHTTS